MRKSLLVLSSCLFVLTLQSIGQTQENPVTASISGVFLDYNGPFTGDYLNYSQFSPGIALGGHVYLAAPLNLSINTSYVPQVKVANDNSNGVARPSQIDVYSLLQFKLNNGRMLKEDAFLAPYFSAGLGLNSINSNTGMYIPVAFGMRFRISRNVQLNLESMYKQSLSKNDPHLAHSAGLVFSLPTNASPKQKAAAPMQPLAQKEPVIRPNSQQDSDGDGIPDVEDACPEMMGLVQFGGCPRKISEPEESIEEAYASVNPASPIEFPHEESNEISLINERATTLTNDSEKIAPLEFEKADLDYLSTFAVNNIYFELNSEELTADSYQVLDKVAEILQKYPDSHLSVKGHTDNTGNDRDNLVLSIKRAFKVKYYLVHEKGIKLSRVESNGFGDSQPLADNSTEDGRQENRRVEFSLQQPSAMIGSIEK